MGGETARRRTEEHGPVIVPRPLGEVERRELEAGYQRVNAAVAELQDHAENVQEELERIERIYGQMDLLRIPELGQRYSDEMESIQGIFTSASEALEAGQTEEAGRLVEQARARMRAIGEIFDIESQMYMAGLPPAVSPEEFTELLDCVEAALLDFGTGNQQRGQNIIAAATLYADNVYFYNVDDTYVDNRSVRDERTSLFGFITARGHEARNGEDYAHGEADAVAMASYARNIESIKAQIIGQDLQVRFARYGDAVQAQINTLAAQEGQEQARRLLQSLHDEMTAFLEKLSRGEEVRAEEITSLERRYHDLIGEPAPMSEDEREAILRESAANLRGSGTTVNDNTAEWFGAQALLALDAGRRDIAALAIQLGLLEKAARTADPRGNGAGAYFSEDDYLLLHDIVTNWWSATPAMISRFSYIIQAANLGLEADSLESTRGGRRERVLEAVHVARERIETGDFEGARRLLEMATTYKGLPAALPASLMSEIADALDAEIAGESGAEERFRTAMVNYEFTSKLDDEREALTHWGEGIAAQRTAVETALSAAEEFQRAGMTERAETLLTLIHLYVSMVQRLGIERRGKIESMNASFNGAGMEHTLVAFAEGSMDAEAASDEFIESYNLNQTAVVDREASRLEELARARPIGRETILDALRTARERAENGDWAGAQVLLGYVKEYYGAAGDGQIEGWMYRAFGAPANAGIEGYSSGSREMLAAIELEMNAGTGQQHTTAAQNFILGAERVDATTRLLAEQDTFRTDYADLRIGLGERRADGTYAEYLTAADVQFYEATYGQQDEALRQHQSSISWMGRYARVEEAPPPLTMLQALMEECESAARAGDMEAYNAARQILRERFDLVTQRAARAQPFLRAMEQLGSLEEAITAIGSSYADQQENALQAYHDAGGSDELAERAITEAYRTEVPEEVQMRLDALETRRAALLAELRTTMLSAETEAVFPRSTYAGFLSDLEIEQRVASADMHVASQIESSLYYEAVLLPASVQGLPRPEGWGSQAERVAEVALRDLQSSRSQLEQARDWLIMAGPENRAEAGRNAEEAYNKGMELRTAALSFYSARGMLTVGESLGLGVSPTELPEETREGLAFPVWRLVTDQSEYQFYVDMQMEAFRSLLSGNVDPERMTDIAKATRLVEISIFAVPAHDTMQAMLSSFDEDQRRVQRLAQEGDFAGAESLLQDMQDRVSRNAQIGRGLFTGALLATAFIPVIGPELSLGLYLTDTADGMLRAYRAGEEIPTSEWIIIGLLVGTYGLGRFSNILRESAATSMAEGDLAAYVTTSRIALATELLQIGVGVGFGVSMVSAAVDSFQDGRNIDGVSYLAMAFLPLAHGTLGSPGMIREAYRLRGMARLLELRARLADMTATEELNLQPTQQERPAIAVEVTQAETPREARMSIFEPEGLFDFLVELRGLDPAAREARLRELELSPALNNAIMALSEEAVIVRAIEEGALNDVAAARLRNALEPFRPEAGPPTRGPTGTRPEVDAAGLLDPGELRLFLLDFTGLTTETSRAAARARLEAIRAQNPEVAAVIDRLLENPTVRQYIETGVESPLSRRMMSNAEQQLESLLRPEVVAAEQRAAMGYYDDVLGGYLERPGAQPERAGAGETRAGGAEVTPIRGAATEPPTRAPPGEAQPPPAPAAPAPAAPAPAVPAGRARRIGRAAGRAGAAVGRFVAPDVTEARARERAAAERRAAQGGTPTDTARRVAESEGERLGRELSRISSPENAAAAIDSADAMVRGAEARARDLRGQLESLETTRQDAQTQRLAAEQRLREATRNRAPPVEIRALNAEIARLRQIEAQTTQLIAQLEPTVRQAERMEADLRSDAQTMRRGLVYGPERMLEIAKSVYREYERAGPGTPEGELYLNVLRRLCSYENVRLYIERAAAGGDAVLGRVLEVAGRPIAEMVGEPMPVEEVLAISRAVEIHAAERSAELERSAAGVNQQIGQLGSEITTAEARRTELGNNILPDLLARVETARNAEAAARQRRDAATTPQARRTADRELQTAFDERRAAERQLQQARAEYDGLGRRLDTARQELDAAQRELERLQALIERYSPMQQTSILLGTDFTPAERISLLTYLADSGVAPERIATQLRGERRAAISASRQSIEAVDTAGSPINDAVRQGLAGREGYGGRVQSGGSLDGAIAEVLSSTQVTDAVKAQYGQAVADAYRATVTGDAFQSAIKEGRIAEAFRLLDTAMASVSQTIQGVRGPAELASGMQRYVEGIRAQPELADHFTIIEQLKTQVSRMTTQTIETRNQQLMRQRRFDLTDGADRVLGRLVENEPLFVQPIRFFQTIIEGMRAPGERSQWRVFDAETYRAAGEAPPELRFWRGGLRGFRSALWRLAVSAIAWGGISYLAYQEIQAARAALDADIDRGLQAARERYGLDISRENALWITLDSSTGEARNPNGRAFWMYMESRTLPPPEDFSVTPVDPGTLRAINGLIKKIVDGGADAAQARMQLEAQLRLKGITGDAVDALIQMWKERGEAGLTAVDILTVSLTQGGLMLNKAKVNELLDDGRRLENIAPAINLFLDQILAGGATGSAARRQLEALLAPWGLTIDQVMQKRSERAARGEGDQLTITDMYDLLEGYWIERGVLFRYTDVVAYDMLCEGGAITPEAVVLEPVHFLGGHPDVLAALFAEAHNGNLPLVFLDDVVELLSAPGELEKLRAQVTATKSLETVIREYLIANNLYISDLTTTTEDGTTITNPPMAANSFLWALSVRAANDPAFLPEYERLLRQYMDDPQALAKFNQFQIGADETIYGSAQQITALAANIVAATDVSTVVADARSQYLIAPRIFAELDPDLLTSPQLVGFALEHSDDNNSGIMRWINDDAAAPTPNIKDLSAILSYLMNESRITDRTTGATRMSPLEIYNPGAAEMPRSYLIQLSDLFFTNGWLNARPAVAPASTTQAAQPTTAPRRRGWATPGGGRETVTAQPQVTGVEAAAEAAPIAATPAEVAPTPEVPVPVLAPEERNEADLFFADPQRSGALGRIARLVLGARESSEVPEALLSSLEGDRRATRDYKQAWRALNESFQSLYGQYPPAEAALMAERDIKAFIWDLLTTEENAGLRERLGITVTRDEAGAVTEVVFADMNAARLGIARYIIERLNAPRPRAPEEGG